MIDWNEVSVLNTDMPQRERNYRRLGDKHWQWSCSICGDSKKNLRKARFGVGENNGTLLCHCFNCGYSNSFRKYLEHKHPDIYRRLQEDKFLDGKLSLFDPNTVFANVDSEETLKKLFFVDRFNSPEEWVAFLRRKKIELSKNNFTKLYNLFRATN